MSLKISRKSNFELLRILCMFGVLTTHILQNCYPSLHTGDFSLQNVLRILLMNISIVAVNCFIMISGYFRIKQELRSFFNLYLQLVFYCGLFSIIGYIFEHESLIGMLKKTIFPLTEGGMWFMTAYFSLFLIAPLINAGFDNLNKERRLLTLICLIFVDVYIGYMHQSEEVTTNGYHIIHFITIYYIGMILSTHKLKSNIKFRIWVLIIFIMTVLHAVKMVFPPIAIVYSMRYNSPMCLITSVIVFVMIKNWSIESKMINWIAASVLSVYVIHSQPIVSYYFFNTLKTISLSSTYSPFLTACLIISITIGLYITCIIFDKFRIVCCNPMVTRIELYCRKIQNNVHEYLNKA